MLIELWWQTIMCQKHFSHYTISLNFFHTGTVYVYIYNYLIYYILNTLVSFVPFWLQKDTIGVSKSLWALCSCVMEHLTGTFTFSIEMKLAKLPYMVSHLVQGVHVGACQPKCSSFTGLLRIHVLRFARCHVHEAHTCTIIAFASFMPATSQGTKEVTPSV